MVQLQSVSKRYGELHALDDINLAVAPGEFIALLGPSGCGKTTLLRAIGGFVEIESGEIYISNARVDGDPPNLRPVNTVFQNYALFPHLTVHENVAFGPRRAGLKGAEIKERVSQALALVEMQPYSERLPSQLSGGQQQRVALARAIINRPKVLLLDEPLSALDLQLRKQMQIELKSLQRRLNMTFIFVTHDQEEALTMADRIAVMKAGKIEQIGSGDQIYNRPNSRYVAEFIGDANILAAQAVSPGQILIRNGGEAIPHEDTVLGVGIVVVRPQHLQFTRPSNADVASLDMTIDSIAFIGNSYRIIGRSSEGERIIVEQQQPPKDIVEGSVKRVYWTAQNCLFLRA